MPSTHLPPGTEARAEGKRQACLPEFNNPDSAPARSGGAVVRRPLVPEMGFVVPYRTFHALFILFHVNLFNVFVCDALGI